MGLQPGKSPPPPCPHMGLSDHPFLPSSALSNRALDRRQGPGAKCWDLGPEGTLPPPCPPLFIFSHFSKTLLSILSSRSECSAPQTAQIHCTLWGSVFLHQWEGLRSPHHASLQLSWGSTPLCHGLSIHKPPSLLIQPLREILANPCDARYTPTPDHGSLDHIPSVLCHLPTLLPGDLRFVPVLGSVLHKLDIGTSLRADVCMEGRRRKEEN